MKLEFYNNYCLILWNREKRNIAKQILMGVLISLFLIFIYHSGALWGNLVTISYCVFIHITCMFDTEKFFSFKDFQILGFEKNDVHFKFAYVLQRILLDALIANSIVMVVVFLYLIIAMKFAAACFFLTIVIMSLCLMPSCHYWAYKIGEQGVIASITVMVAGFVLLIVGCAENFYPLTYFFSGNSYLHSFVLMIAAMIYMFFLDFLVINITLAIGQG